MSIPLRAIAHEMFVTRRSIALRAASANALAITLGVLLGDPVFGVMGYFGTFIIQYGEGRAYPYRMRIQLASLASISACVLLGYLASTVSLMGWVVLVGVSFLSVLTVHVANIGPPGAFYMMLATGVGLLLSERGSDLVTLFLAIAMGATLSLLLTWIDTLANPNKPERLAVERVTSLVHAYEQLGDDEDSTHLQAEVTQALVTAWTTLMEAGYIQHVAIPESSALPIPTISSSTPAQAREDYAAILRDAHYRFITREAYLAGRDYTLIKSPGFAYGTPAQQQARVKVRAGEFSAKILGKPSFVSSMEDAMRWPSEPLLIAGRSMIGAAIAGLLCLQFGSGRVDWAMAFAVMLLNMGGTRKERIGGTLYRGLVTALGIGLSILMITLPFSPLIFAVEIFILRYIFVGLSKRYYNFSTIFMAVVAVVSIGISVEGFHLATISQMAYERATDSLFSIIGVVLVMTFAFRRSDVLFIRGYTYRTLQTIGHVMDDVVMGRVETAYAMANRRRLYLALLACEQVSVRAEADDPEGAGRYGETTEALLALGYCVVGAALHPVMMSDTRPFALASTHVTGLLSQPFTQPQAPEVVTETLRHAMHALKTGQLPEPPN